MAVGMPPELPVPPDSYAAHLAELPAPGSRVFDARDALALALMYNCMDPDRQKEMENLREDIRSLSDQNQNLNAYAQMIYIVANKLRAQLATVMEHNAKVEAELQKLKDNELSATSHLQLRDASTALKAMELERDSLRAKVHELELQLQSAPAYDSDPEDLPQSDVEDGPATTPQDGPTFVAQAAHLRGRPRVDDADGEDMLTDPVAKRRLRHKLAGRRYRERKAQLARQNDQRIAALTKEVGELRAQLAAQAVTAPEDQGSIDADRLRLQTTLAIERRRHADELRAVVQDQERLRALSGAEKEKRAALESERDNVVEQLVVQRADRAQVAQERDHLRKELDVLQTRVDTLEADLAGTTQERDRLRGQLRDAEQTTRESESKFSALQASAVQQLDELRRTSASITQERDELRAELTALRKAADDQKTQLHASLRESKKLKDDAKSLRDRIADLETKLQNAEQAVRDATAEAARLPQLASERDALASEIEGLRARTESGRNDEHQVGTLTETVDRLSGKLEKAFEELSDTAKQLQERKAELATLSAERARWTVTTNELKAKLEHAQTELDKRQKQLSTSQASTHHWKKEYDSACKEHADKLRELGKLLSSAREQRDRAGTELRLERDRAVTELRLERERSQSESNRYQSLLESARKTSSGWQSKYDTAAKALSTSKTEVEKKLAAECDQLRKVVASLRAESSALREKLATALRENKETKEKNSEVAKLSDFYCSQNKALEGTFKGHQRKVRNLEDMLEAGKKDYEDMVQKYDDLRTTTTQLEEKLALTTGDHKCALRKVQSVECSLKEATAEVAALRSRIAGLTEALQKERTRPQREINELRAENDRLCEQIDELEQANAKLMLHARGPSGTR